MKSIAFLLIGLFVFSCGTKNNEVKSSDKKETTEQTKPERNIMLTAKFGMFDPSSPFEIQKVTVKGNTMFVDISYPGGCGVHEFKAVGNLAIMKSMPPQRMMKVIHTSKSELCKSIVNNTLEIDITEMANDKTPGSVIYLLLEGWEERIEYTFE